MGIVERKQRQREQLKSSILDTAQDIAIQEGWQAVSIRKIADVIEYSAPVIYEHFENKEAILLELMQRGFRKMTEMLLTAKSQYEDPEGQVMAVAKAYMKFAFENKELYQVMFSIGGVCCGAASTEMESQTLMRNGLTVIGDALKALLLKKGHTEEDMSNKFYTFFALKHGIISLTLVGRIKGCEAKAEQILEDAVVGFIRSL